MALLDRSNEMECTTASESSEKQCRVGNDNSKNTASPRTPKQWHIRRNRRVKLGYYGNHARRILRSIDACPHHSGDES